MKQAWQIDPEFKRLSVPLSPEEERRLENSLVREGCKEPIAVWHDCILDGHKRYEICSYEEIEYETVEMDFATKDEALLWACKEHLSKARHDRISYKYLVGKRYIMEKKKYKAQRDGRNEDGPEEVIPTGRVCLILAADMKMCHNTIKRYGTLAAQMDKIAEKDEVLFGAILAEKIPITYAQLSSMSKMDSTKLANIRRRLLREKDVKMRQRKPRQQSTDSSSGKTQQEQAAPLEVGIKEMPMFDPDMEFRGLTLTIPTWMNAIARTRAKTHIDLVSEPTKAQLAMTLRRLEEQITQMLEVIEK